MAFKRNIYLKMKTLKEARDILFQTFSNLPSLPTEEISVPDAVDRQRDREVRTVQMAVRQQHALASALVLVVEE